MIGYHRAATGLAVARSDDARTLGPQLLGVLRAREYTFPVVLITAVQVLAEPFLDGDRVICIAKPFEIDALLACVAQYLGRPASS